MYWYIHVANIRLCETDTTCIRVGKGVMLSQDPLELEYHTHTDRQVSTTTLSLPVALSLSLIV